MSDDQVAVRLSDDDIAKLKEWYKDICGAENEEARFWEFLKKDPGYGTNHRVLGRFFNLTDEEDRAKLEYFFKVYVYQATVERADDSDWKVRAAILVTLVTPTIAFLADWLAAPMTRGSWHSPMLWFGIVYLGATVIFYEWSTEIMAWFKKKKAKK